MPLEMPRVDLRSILVGLGLTTFVAGAVGLWIAVTQPTRSLEKDWRFVRQVLLTTEYDGDERPIRRWIKSPVVFALVREGEDRRRFERAVATINRALRGTGIDIQAHYEKGQPHDIVFGVLDQDDFDQVMTGYGCRPTLTRSLGAGCALSKDAQIEFVAVMVSAKLMSDAFESTILEEMYQALGVFNDHMVYAASLFYDGHGNDRTKTDLAPIDIQVLRFLYMYLEPGDDTATVRAKFDAHWRDVPVD